MPVVPNRDQYIELTDAGGGKFGENKIQDIPVVEYLDDSALLHKNHVEMILTFLRKNLPTVGEVEAGFFTEDYRNEMRSKNIRCWEHS